MRQVQDVVDDSIESLNILLEPTEDYGKKIDISSLDFDLIEKEFLKFENKNSMVQSLKQKIETKLNQMLNNNPLRIDYYEQYKAIIDEYNKGKDTITIEETFERLLNFVRDLSEEDARAKKEDLNEGQLAIFDLLRQGKQLTTKERNKVKGIASELLDSLDGKELKVNHWMDKPQTSAAVKTAINNYLFEQLPYPTYEEQDIESKSFLIFDYLRGSYKSAS